MRSVILIGMQSVTLICAFLPCLSEKWVSRENRGGFSGAEALTGQDNRRDFVGQLHSGRMEPVAVHLSELRVD